MQITGESVLFVVEYTHDSVACEPAGPPGHTDIWRNYFRLYSDFWRAHCSSQCTEESQLIVWFSVGEPHLLSWKPTQNTWESFICLTAQVDSSLLLEVTLRLLLVLKLADRILGLPSFPGCILDLPLSLSQSLSLSRSSPPLVLSLWLCLCGECTTNKIFLKAFVWSVVTTFNWHYLLIWIDMSYQHFVFCVLTSQWQFCADYFSSYFIRILEIEAKSRVSFLADMYHYNGNYIGEVSCDL